MLSDRFKTMYRQLGLSRLQAAQLLHVSERTLHNWDIGHHEIPYSAYKLLRLLSYTELPGKAWDGWHIAVGQLWSPEGYGFKPTDSNWWSNLCRRAELFHVLYKENQQLRQALAVVATPDRASGAPHVSEPAKTAGAGGEVAVTPHFSLTGGTNQQNQTLPAGSKDVPETRHFSPQIRKISPTIAVNSLPLISAFERRKRPHLAGCVSGIAALVTTSQASHPSVIRYARRTASACRRKPKWRCLTCPA